jgi:GTP 3',8-cyclase
VRVVGVFVGLGVRQVRLTGGEPLLRRSLVDVVRRIAALEPRPRIAMTTNGVGLDRLAQPLADAGLDRVNISLDTIDPKEFADLTRRDRLHDVEAGLKAAATAGLAPVKVNAVAMRGINDHSVAELLQWCLDRGYELRFIEQMPLDAQHGWDASTMVPAAEVRERLEERFRLSPLGQADRGSAPAERFLVDGGPETVGIIASVTAPFCAACDRTRLTADGQVRNCLFSRRETDLRAPLRDGASDDELARLIQGEMWRKARGHGIGTPDFVQPDRPMSSIGG